MPGSFGVGAGIKIINHLLAGPKAGEYDIMCAFVPVSVAKTEADARDYIVNQMIKGFNPVAKEQGYELAGTSTEPLYYDEKAKPSDREKAWQVIGSTFVINENVGCGKTRSDQCLFAVRLEKDTEPQQPAPVPAWIDPDQPMAWFFPTIRVISKLNGVEVSKRDEVRYDWLTAWAKHFPKNTFMYVSPAKKDGKPLFAIDAINLLESGMGNGCDVTVGILAPKPVRLARIMARDHLSEQAARARIDAQKPDEFYRTGCQVILTNDTSLEAFRDASRRLLNDITKEETP